MKRFLRLAADWPLLPYNLVLLLFSPVVLVLKAWRYYKKGWKREYDLSRWFIPPASLSTSPRIVLIGTGWGEMRLVELLDGALKTHTPGTETIWVLRDREAIAAVKREHPGQAVTFLPFDFLVPVLLWLRRVKPDVVVFTEKFWFPTLVRGCWDWGAAVMVMNARTRAHDKARYNLFEPFHRWVGSSFDAMVFQSEADRDRAGRALSPQTRAVVAGNLKFALRPASDGARADGLKNWLAQSGAPIMAAGSVEDGDLGFVLEAFQEVRRDHACRLLIAPRRAHLAEGIESAARAAGLSVNRRSHNTTEAADVYLLDTMGELATAYQFCRAAFVGGTLKIGAGHNVVEPLAFGVPVSYGPNRGFFESVQLACEEARVGFRLRTPAELATHWKAMVTDKKEVAAISERAAALLERERAALSENLSVVLELAKTRAAS